MVDSQDSEGSQSDKKVGEFWILRKQIETHFDFFHPGQEVCNGFLILEGAEVFLEGFEGGGFVAEGFTQLSHFICIRRHGMNFEVRICVKDFGGFRDIRWIEPD